MRLRVLIGVPLIAVGLLVTAFFASRSGPAIDIHNDVLPAEPSPGPPAVITSQAAAPTPTIASRGINTPTAHQTHAAYIRRRTEELETLAMKNDTASRDAILAELQNPDKEIRHAAREAAIQFGDRSVVPRLQQVAEETEDPAEKAEIVSAIDYINLPSLTEYLATNPRSGQTNLLHSSTNHPGWGSRVRRQTP